MGTAFLIAKKSQRTFAQQELRVCDQRFKLFIFYPKTIIGHSMFYNDQLAYVPTHKITITIRLKWNFIR